MIKGPGPVSPEYNALLNRLAIGAHSEVTEAGFEYLVFDPARLQGAGDLVLGTVLTKPDVVEVELFVSGDIDPSVRPALAEICAESSPDNDRYSLARSADVVLGLLDGPADDTKRQHSARVVDSIKANMRLHALGVESSRRQRQDVDPQLFATLRSTLGWVAFRRDLSPEGAETLERFNRDGLWIPGFESKQRVTGQLTMPTGTRVNGGFVAMTEKSERHVCPDCTGQILKGTTRITLQTDERDAYSDHHHFHSTCFIEDVLPKFKASSLTLEPNPHAMG